jgi:carboxyl-terminal processing protease
MPVDEAVLYIRGKKGTVVTLTIKKPDGQIEEITIVRDVVIIEETYAKSAVIKDGKTGPKVGYITLPSFYHDFNKPNGRTSSGDVRQELEKLKKEQVAGVILDLRNNAGGALDDAVKMAGLFIESGPIVQSKDGKGDITVYRDPDDGIVYDGPLVVMVNTLSASASEIVAAALQDYNRAVIVGSAHTFGKGTVQGMVNLDHFLDYLYPQQVDYKPLGSLKLTEGKYYRINGGATQLKGVESDLILPDPYAYLEIGEQYYDYPLPWDQVKALNYQQWTGGKWDLATLKANSAARINANPNFTVTQKSIERVRQQQEESLQPLKLAKFLERERKVRLEAEKLNKTLELKSGLQFKLVGEAAKNKDQAELQQEWLDQLSTDFYLEEAFWIVHDLFTAQGHKEAA